MLYIATMNAAHIRRAVLTLGILTAGWSAQAQAQDAPAPRRTRVVLGPQLVPSYPGSDDLSLRPFVDVSRARGDEQFAFEAPDESFGFSVLRRGGFAVGPSLGFQGNRTADDVGVPVRRVGTTVEVGGFAQYDLTPSFRVRAEVRHGLGGHRGLVGNLSADYVVRDRDEWLFSVGPRLTLANNRYHRAYFGVTPADALSSGLPVFKADGGVQAVGAAAGLMRQLTPRWGVQAFARYDRLIADPARSPIVRGFGSRDQPSAGVAATFTFGRGVN